MSQTTQVESEPASQWTPPIPKNVIRDRARTLIARNIVMQRRSLQSMLNKDVQDRPTHTRHAYFVTEVINEMLAAGELWAFECQASYGAPARLVSLPNVWMERVL